MKKAQMHPARTVHHPSPVPKKAEHTTGAARVNKPLRPEDFADESELQADELPFSQTSFDAEDVGAAVLKVLD